MTPKGSAIELLAPARDVECGLAALRHGADALYVGASRFGARQAAGNSLDDISRLIEAARFYSARVYVTLNTLLFDRELPQIEDLVHQLYQRGADAIIFQDMALLEMDLPPIALHASTQADNRTPEKVRFLEEAGVEQVVLARELSLEEIRKIRQETKRIQLEVFVHGSLCVSYSGRCFASHRWGGRSANRGVCAQPCRLPYRVTTHEGTEILKGKHLLSLKDLWNGPNLEDLLQAGATSFKIEGRLKDISYVKNVTAWYRQALDKLLEKNPSWHRSSCGTEIFSFVPAPEKTFSRGFTDHFLYQRQKDSATMGTPKAIGAPLAKVLTVRKNHFTLPAHTDPGNGDGLCYFNSRGELEGFRVDRVEIDATGNSGKEKCYRICARFGSSLKEGTLLYRNHHQAFARQVEKSRGERKVGLKITIVGTRDSSDRPVLIVTATDEEGLSSQLERTIPQTEGARDTHGTARARENLERQFSRWGNSPFHLEALHQDLDQKLEPIPSVPLSWMNSLRRDLAEVHEKKRRSRRPPDVIRPPTGTTPFPTASEEPSLNITNTKARAFYKRHGVGETPPAPDALPRRAPHEAALPNKKEEMPVMLCRYCLRHELDLCPRQGGSPAHPLILEGEPGTLEARFDCERCEMQLYLISPRPAPG
ncbi:putative protease [Alkalispirochaeta americana]|uniref:Putative protease n=1 Tax=Alkalispirochaeta americana TaxID=159291 RepID=A0A1N6SWU1_9SPIO|nr:U32 family peptidase [Alkalispirochaeta americana]SIQ45569.1 putative protease [Alkalispirochaeta americana]